MQSEKKHSLLLLTPDTSIDGTSAAEMLQPSQKETTCMNARDTADDLLAQARHALLSGAPETVESTLSPLGPGHRAYADALHVRGLAHAAAGRIAAALPLFQEAHRLRPDDIELAGNLAKALGRVGRYRESLMLNDRLLCAGHRSAERFCDCGIMLLELERDAEALVFFNLALDADPKRIQAWFGKATLMQGYRDAEEALLCHDRVVLLAPGHAFYRSYRAVALTELARFDEAMREHDLALALDPLAAPLWKNRAMTLIRCDRHEEALSAMERAHALAPSDAAGLCLQGEALCELKRFDEAQQRFDEALWVDPEFHDAAVKRSWLLISLGNYRDGWREHERRLANMKPQLLRHQHLPAWTGGEDLAGKRIVVWDEQGYGDVIQHCRFVLDLKALGAEVVLEIRPQLAELCASLPGCQVITIGAPLPPCDFQIPVASLPLALGIGHASIPHAAGYLQASVEAVDRWSAALPPAQHPMRIGIACSGFGGHARNLMRSMPLRHFLPLAEHADLFVLQPALQAEDERFQERHPEIQRPHIDADSFADTAALVQNMDLVISVDTSIAHLAASLGKETWILLDWVSEWRWMHDITYSAWYRSVTLFRQPARADWSAVIGNVLQALTQGRQA